MCLSHTPKIKMRYVKDFFRNFDHAVLGSVSALFFLVIEILIWIFSFDATIPMWVFIISLLISYFICLAIYGLFAMQNQHKKENSAQDNSLLINSMFQTMALSLQYPNDTPVNIHYFFYAKENNIEYLVKNRRYSYEMEHFTKGYSLERHRLDAPNIVICEAFSKNTAIFKKLPANHINTYNQEDALRIDDDLKWILACPVWKGSSVEERVGVVCVFGKTDIVDSNDTKNIHKLESICTALAKHMSSYFGDNS